MQALGRRWAEGSGAVQAKAQERSDLAITPIARHWGHKCPPTRRHRLLWAWRAAPQQKATPGKADNSQAAGADQLGQGSCKGSGAGPGKQPGVDDEDDGVINALLAIDPVTGFVAERIISALVNMVVAGVLGSWLSINLWSLYKLDGSAALLAVQASVPLVLGVVVVACLPTGTLSNTTPRQRQLLSTAEDDIIMLGPFIDHPMLLFPVVSSNAAFKPTQQQLMEQVSRGQVPTPGAVPTSSGTAAAATTRPLQSGLRLFQLWVTKPWCPEVSPLQMAAMTASSGLQLATSELLTRGIVVALLAGWLRDAVASADQSSVLFWNKLFRVTDESSYRWFGTWVVAACSMVFVVHESECAQRWARLVLFRLSQQQDKQQQGAAAASGSDQTATVATAAVTMLGAAPGIAVALSQRQEGTTMAAAAAGEQEPAEGPPDPLEGLTFTEFIQQPVRSINITTTVGGSVKLCEAEENLAPTQEDMVVWNLAMVIGTMQVVQLALLFGSTGMLLAPLLAQLLLDGSGQALMRTLAKGEQPTLASMTINDP